MPVFEPPKVIWTGQLTDNGPVMNVVEDRWGQHLAPADTPPTQPPAPRQQQTLFAMPTSRKPAYAGPCLCDPDDI